MSEPIAEWERELIEEQWVEQQRADAERLALAHEVVVREGWWIKDGFKVTITPTEPWTVRQMLDEIREQMSRIQRP